MKNLISKIVKQIKTQVFHLERFAFALTIPVVIGNPLNLSIPVVEFKDTEKQASEVKTEKVTNITFDNKNPKAIVLVEKNLEIKLTESNFDREQRLAKESTRIMKRDVIAREKSQFRADLTLEQKRALVKAAAARYGIPWQVLEAVWQVESGKSWDTSRCSYAGATGPMQFLPSTFRKYGVDANGDGRVDIASAHDSVYAAANLLASSGASSGQVERALFAYNHSYSYVQKVLRIAREIGY